MQRFVILTEQRSGSHMLMLSFDDHPNIGHPANSEPFAHKGGKYAPDTSTAEILEKNFQYQDSDFSCKYPDEVKAVGIIVHGSQKDLYDESAWKQTLKMKDLKIIFLERKNLLRRYLSKLIAKDIGFINVELHPEMPKYKIENKKLIKDFKTILGRREEMREDIKNMDSINIVYEDLISDYDKTMKRIQKFIGVPVKKLWPKTIKQNPRTLPDSIENYAQLKEDSKNTEWQAFFD